MEMMRFPRPLGASVWRSCVPGELPMADHCCIGIQGVVLLFPSETGLGLPQPTAVALEDHDAGAWGVGSLMFRKPTVPANLGTNANDINGPSRRHARVEEVGTL